jgi:hypothetical protein
MQCAIKKQLHYIDTCKTFYKSNNKIENFKNLGKCMTNTITTLIAANLSFKPSSLGSITMAVLVSRVGISSITSEYLK